MEFNFVAKSDIGENIKHNEDGATGVIADNTLFLMISDYFGATYEKEEDNENIGKIIADRAQNYITNLYKNYYNIEMTKVFLKQVVYYVNGLIIAYQSANPNVYRNLRCSFTICAITQNKEIAIAHIGDTRLYVIRSNQIFCGTQDDNEAYKLLSEGKITKEEYENHELRAKMTNVLGKEENINCQLINTNLIEKDFVVLATDGVYRTLGDERIKNLIYNAGNLDTSGQWIIDGVKKLNNNNSMSIIVSYII